MLAPPTLERVLDRLGFDAAPVPDADGLARVYLAWCRAVPFDNLVKRIHLGAGDPGPLPNGTAGAFFDLYLRHGTGGTCWPSANALHALLVALGFEARRGSAAMMDTLAPGEPQHSHGTTLVRVDGTDHWVDSSMLTDRVLPLERGAVTTLEHPVHLLRAEPVGDLWRIWWEPGPPGEEMSCLLLDEDVTGAHYLDRYEVSRGWSPFNLGVHAVRNTDAGRVTVRHSQRFERRADGSDTRTFDGRAERDKVLVEEFGYSEEIVAAVPDDERAALPS